MLAGYETTANALAYTVYCLSLNPEKEAKVLAEIDAWGADRAPGFDDLDKFPYTEAAFKEATRLFPPGTALVREAEKGTVIAGHTIPQGTWLHVRP